MKISIQDQYSHRLLSLSNGMNLPEEKCRWFPQDDPILHQFIANENDIEIRVIRSAQQNILEIKTTQELGITLGHYQIQPIDIQELGMRLTIPHEIVILDTAKKLLSLALNGSLIYTEGPIPPFYPYPSLEEHFQNLSV